MYMKNYKNKCMDCKCRVDNRTKRCSTCYKKWRESTREERKESFKIYQKQWYKENKNNVIEKSKTRHKNLAFSKRKSYTIKHKYNITIEEFEEKLKFCDYKCFICDKIHSLKDPLHIDHCHKSKEVRGLLCKKCNFGLGNFDDNIDKLKKSIIYLEKWKNIQKSMET